MKTFPQEVKEKEVYEAPCCELFAMRRLSILEQVSIFAEVEDLEDGGDI